MGQPAGNLLQSGGLAAVAALLAPFPGRAAFAGRQAVICALVAVVVMIYQTPEPALTIYMVFFLNRADRAGSLLTNVLLLVLMTLVIGLVCLLAMAVIDQPVWRVASIAAASFGLLFLASASKLRPIAPIVALITGYGLDKLGSAPGGEIALRGLLYAWLFAAIPVSVSVIVNLLIAPAPRRLAEREIAARLRASAALLQTSDPAASAAVDACVEAAPGEVPTWLRLAGKETTSSPEDLAALRHAADASVAILLLTRIAASDTAAGLPIESRHRIAATLGRMAAILESDGYPLEVRLAAPGKLAPEAAATLAGLREALVHFAEAEPASEPESGMPTPDAPRGFFLPDAFSDPVHVQFALKTTAAAMTCYMVYQLLNWPGIHTCFITCYIVALSTTGEAVEKLVLRIAGCLIGAAVGIAAIVAVLPWLTSIGGLTLLVTVGMFASAWVAGGSPRISYAGFQIGFAFLLCVVQGPAPAFDTSVARDRVIGILLADVVCYFTFAHVWPVSVASRIDTSIATLLRTLVRLANAATAGQRRTLSASALATRAAIAGDLDLARYEPSGVRAPACRLQARADVLGAAVSLTGEMLADGETATALRRQVALRGDGLAAALAGTGTGDQPRNSGGHSADALARLERAVRHATAPAMSHG